MTQHTSTSTSNSSRDLDKVYAALRAIENAIEFVLDEHDDRDVDGAYPHEPTVKKELVSIKSQARILRGQLVAISSTLRALPK